MGEWLKPTDLKSVKAARSSGVRIPLPPPHIYSITSHNIHLYPANQAIYWLSAYHSPTTSYNILLILAYIWGYIWGYKLFIYPKLKYN